MLLLVPPYVVKKELVNESRLREARGAVQRAGVSGALRAFSHRGPTYFAYLAIKPSFSVDPGEVEIHDVTNDVANDVAR